MAIPFEAYNPNNDDLCAILRSLKGTLIRTTPRDLARHLLDNHQLVAVGEFPDFTAEELERLASKSIQVRFRIRRLYQGEGAVSIMIELNSDILAIPGEVGSRYAKRQDLLDHSRAYMDPDWFWRNDMPQSIAVRDFYPQTLIDRWDGTARVLATLCPCPYPLPCVFQVVNERMPDSDDFNLANFAFRGVSDRLVLGVRQGRRTSFALSPHIRATAYRDRLARDVGAGIGREKHGDALQVLGFAKPAQRRIGFGIALRLGAIP